MDYKKFSINKEQCKAMAKFLSCGIVNENLITSDFLDYIKEVVAKIEPNENDDEMTLMFKYFILFGNATSLVKHAITDMSPSEISDIICDHAANDIDITLLAKAIHAIQTRSPRIYLEKQIAHIIEKGNIDEESIAKINKNVLERLQRESEVVEVKPLSLCLNDAFDERVLTN